MTPNKEAAQSERFEKVLQESGRYTDWTKSPDGEYQKPRVQEAWLIWQAALTTPAAEQPTVKESLTVAEPVAAPAQAQSDLASRVRALAEKWNKDAIDTGFAMSEPAYELFEALDAAPPTQQPQDDRNWQLREGDPFSQTTDENGSK